MTLFLSNPTKPAQGPHGASRSCLKGSPGTSLGGCWRVQALPEQPPRVPSNKCPSLPSLPSLPMASGFKRLCQGTLDGSLAFALTGPVMADLFPRNSNMSQFRFTRGQAQLPSPTLCMQAGDFVPNFSVCLQKFMRVHRAEAGVSRKLLRAKI